jgi:type I restriction enzyme S subunit
MSATPGALPVGWALARIGDLVSAGGKFVDGDWVETKDQDPNGDVRLVQLADVGDGDFLNKSHRFLTNEAARRLGCTFLERGDVLIARMPDPLGRACLFPGDPKPCVTAVDVCIVRTASQVSHRWLVWMVNAPQFRSRIAALQSGSTRQRISRSNLATIPLPVAPVQEQDRIVAEIEKQFTRLDAAVESLRGIVGVVRGADAIVGKANRLRLSILKSAFDGRLVSQDPSDEPATDLLARIKRERQANTAAASSPRHLGSGQRKRTRRDRPLSQE